MWTVTPSGSGVATAGTPGVSVHFGRCCTPVPGDRIVGILEPETGLTVHTIDCQALAAFADDDSVWHDLQWTPQAETDAVAAVRLNATIRNAPGVLGQVTTLIGEAGGTPLFIGDDVTDLTASLRLANLAKSLS